MRLQNIALGYTIRGTLITHLNEIEHDAESSLGNIRIIPKESILELWKFVKQLLIDYRASWSLDNLELRKIATEQLRPKLPTSGWFLRVLNTEIRFLTADILLAEWKKA